MRWKDPMTPQVRASTASRSSLRFVSSRPPRTSRWGACRSWASRWSRAPAARSNLVMRRAMPDDAAKDFGPLDKAAAARCCSQDVDSVTFAYFGAENDFTDPHWTDTWSPRAHSADGSH